MIVVGTVMDGADGLGIVFVGVRKLTPTYRILRSITGSFGHSLPVRWIDVIS